MSKFRSKPFEIEAVQLRAPMHNVPKWMLDEYDAGRLFTFTDDADGWHWRVTTANGEVTANVDDWLIREPSGIGCYPCNPEVFAAKYEAAE